RFPRVLAVIPSWLIFRFLVPKGTITDIRNRRGECQCRGELLKAVSKCKDRAASTEWWVIGGEHKAAEGECRVVEGERWVGENQWRVVETERQVVKIEWRHCW